MKIHENTLKLFHKNRSNSSVGLNTLVLKQATMNFGITVDWSGFRSSTVSLAFCTAVSFGLLCTSKSLSRNSSWQPTEVEDKKEGVPRPSQSRISGHFEQIPQLTTFGVTLAEVKNNFSTKAKIFRPVRMAGFNIEQHGNVMKCGGFVGIEALPNPKPFSQLILWPNCQAFNTILQKLQGIITQHEMI